MPQLSGVCEAQRRIINLDRRLGRQPFERLVNRLLVFARDQLFGQLLAAVVQLRPALLWRVGLYSLFELEDVKTVVGFDYRAYISRVELSHGLLEHFRKLTFVISGQPAAFGVGRV